MNIDTRPLTLGTVIKVILFIAVCILLAALTWHADAQDDTQRITAITCLQGDTLTIDAPAPLVTLELKHNGTRWLWPERIGLHKLKYTLTYADGAQMLVGIAYDYGKPTTAYGMLWTHGEPDWRNIGDGQPHPQRIVRVSTVDAVRLLVWCGGIGKITLPHARIRGYARTTYLRCENQKRRTMQERAHGKRTLPDAWRQSISGHSAPESQRP